MSHYFISTLLLIQFGIKGLESKCSEFPPVEVNGEWFADITNPNPKLKRHFELVWSGKWEPSELRPDASSQLRDKLLEGYTRFCGVISITTPTQAPPPLGPLAAEDEEGDSPLPTNRPLEAPLTCEYKIDDPASFECESKSKGAAPIDTMPFTGAYNVTMTDHSTYLVLSGCINKKSNHFHVMWLKHKDDFTGTLKNEIKAHLKSLKFTSEQMREDPLVPKFSSLKFIKCGSRKGGPISQSGISKPIMTATNIDKTIQKSGL